LDRRRLFSGRVHESHPGRRLVHSVKISLGGTIKK
jgi:hypothetical protein